MPTDSELAVAGGGAGKRRRSREADAAGGAYHKKTAQCLPAQPPEELPPSLPTILSVPLARKCVRTLFLPASLPPLLSVSLSSALQRWQLRLRWSSAPIWGLRLRAKSEPPLPKDTKPGLWIQRTCPQLQPPTSLLARETRETKVIPVSCVCRRVHPRRRSHCETPDSTHDVQRLVTARPWSLSPGSNRCYF